MKLEELRESQVEGKKYAPFSTKIDATIELIDRVLLVIKEMRHAAPYEPDVQLIEKWADRLEGDQR